MKLSTADLELFFDDRHHALSARLAATRDDLAAAEREHAGADRAHAVAAALGRLGLCAWLVPDPPGAQDSPGARDKGSTASPADIPEPGAPGRVDVRALCLIREFLGYVSPLADAIFAVQGLGTYPLTRVPGSPAELVERCKSGASIGGFALTEPEAGSDVASMQCRARHDRGRTYRLEGTKTLISNVGIASHYVVFANADPEAGRKGISAFLLRAGASGLAERPIELNVDHPIGELVMDGCEAELLGDEGGGFKLAMQTLDTFRVTVGAAAVGMARRAVDEALAHVRARRQFGRALAEQQIVQTYLADMATELDAARLLVLRAAHSRDRAADPAAARERLTREAAMAKLYATEAAQRIIDRAVQLLGGRGVVAGQVVEGLYRAIRPLRIYEGTSEIQRLIIGRAMAKG